jgi:tRNA (adenine37-N6)-methyltransferase
LGIGRSAFISFDAAPSNLRSEAPPPPCTRTNDSVKTLGNCGKSLCGHKASFWPARETMKVIVRWSSATILAFLVMTAFTRDGCMAENYSIQPVGRVINSSTYVGIEIFPAFREALLGMEGFSHIIVLYWFDRNDTPEKRDTLRVHPRADKNNPLTGVFATRSPRRPNLIGLSVCKIKSVEQGRILVDTIDALDQTPVVDIKPYIPVSDCVPDASVPWWVGKEGTR